MKFRRILLILAIATLSLTACKKEENPAPTETTAIEETTTGITKEQLITLHEHAESVYAETPELFTEDADISIIDLPEITDAEIPVSEAITIEEAMQFFAEEYKDYWMSYELQYAINNPDGGLPESLYKAMVVAKQVGLVTGEESRWDEALTKNEALNFILRVYENMETVTNADRGQATGEVVEAPTTENTEYDTTIEEGDYDEEVHGEQANQPPAEGTDEFQQMLEEMAKEIYNSNGGGITYIPADPAVEAALGGTYGTTESRNPDSFGHGDYSGLEGGSLY